MNIWNIGDEFVDDLDDNTGWGSKYEDDIFDIDAHPYQSGFCEICDGDCQYSADGVYLGDEQEEEEED